MEHQPHIAKPKIAKNASSKLPEAFRVQASSNKRSTEHVDDHKNHVQSQSKNDNRQIQKQLQKKQRKSKNPFLPLKQFMKKAQDLAKQMKVAQQDIEKLSKYSISGNIKGKSIKYQQCITLSIVRKQNNSCLKKILHVPTLTIHFLRQSNIQIHFDKSEINQWISFINQKQGENCIKILEIFWNMPQDNYSLLYQYSDGLPLDSLNQSLHTLPISLLKDIALAHLSSSVGIFNSQIILYEQNGSKVIKYLPLYQQTDFLIGQSKKMKDITTNQLADITNIQSKFIWKLGLILLNGYLGSVILSQDLQKLTFPLKKCCLLHEILSTPSSLSALFLSLNMIQDEYFCDFLCKCLRSKKHSQKDPRYDIKTLRNHKFLQKKYGQIISLGQIIEVVDPSSNIKSKFEITKMNKIMDSVSLILQGTTQVDMKITAQNRDVIWLAKQLGMRKQIDKVVNQLKKVYK